MRDKVSINDFLVYFLCLKVNEIISWGEKYVAIQQLHIQKQTYLMVNNWAGQTLFLKAFPCQSCPTCNDISSHWGLASSPFCYRGPILATR